MTLFRISIVGLALDVAAQSAFMMDLSMPYGRLIDGWTNSTMIDTLSV